MTLNPVLSVAEQMELAIRAHERVPSGVVRSRSIEALERVGLSAAASRIDHYPHQFSGGMRQRVAIAIAMLHRPALIIADEPTTALDVSVQAQILVEMRRLAADQGTSLIWISHDLAVISSLCDRVAVMYAGRVVEDGSIAEVLSSPRHPYTEGLLASLPSLAAPGERLTPIRGAPPSIGSLPPGCALEPRCSHAVPACRVAPGVTTERDRSWRCHNPLPH
jgi:peptide/nickel transport system ATP-binding protein